MTRRIGSLGGEVRLTGRVGALQQMGRVEEAQRMHERAVELAPDEPTCLCNLAQFLHAKKKQHKLARKVGRIS